jgi:hypothetical protein
MTQNRNKKLTNLFLDNDGSAPQQFKGFIEGRNGGIILPSNLESYPERGVVHTWVINPKKNTIDPLRLSVVFSESGAVSIGVNAEDALNQSEKTSQLFQRGDTMSQGAVPTRHAQDAIDGLKKSLDL